MLGSGDPTPYDFPLLVLFGIVAVVLIAGAIVGDVWSPLLAPWLRRGSVLIATCAFAAVLLLTPTQNGIVGAGRMLTIFPAYAVVVLIFLLCSWRAGGL